MYTPDQFAFGYSRFIFGLSKGGGADSTSPTVISATVDTTGLVWTIVFSEAVAGMTGSGFTTAGGITLTYTSGNNTGTGVFAGSSALYTGVTDTLTYTPGTIADATGNALQAFSGAAITNNSTLWEPPAYSGLVLWLKASGSYESTAGGGGGSAAANARVGRWLDASGNAKHADAPDANGRVTRAADGRGVFGNNVDVLLQVQAILGVCAFQRDPGIHHYLGLSLGRVRWRWGYRVLRRIGCRRGPG